VSVPLQNKPSLHGALLLGCVHAPVPLQTSFVHALPSVAHAFPAVSLQLSAASLQTSAQSAPPLHGSPA
jgi:hypothetical protein